MKARLLLCALLLTFFLPLAASSDPLPTAPPESVGLSPERLKRITDSTSRQMIARPSPLCAVIE
jgi:hypothetical protein